MNTQNFKIDNIPAILWGDASDKLYLYVHGKHACKEHAERFAEIAASKGYQTLSFDLPEHGERIGSNDRCTLWNGMRDLSTVADYAFSNWPSVALYACSIGAFFSLYTYADKTFSKCLFQSPIVDMGHLIQQMFIWFNVTEVQLRVKGEIDTPIDPLCWDVYEHVLTHPVRKWHVPTSILYGGKDTLQALETIQAFAQLHSCQVTLSKDSEHAFMAPKDAEIVTAWLEKQV